MKKVMITALTLLCAMALTVNAADEKKEKKGPERTPEQRALLKQITAKYDKDGDKKLSKEERASISKEDKAKMEKAGLGPKKKDGEKKKPADQE